MAKKAATAFDPRRVMEKAVEAMRESVPERRADGSPSPKVGAVLVRQDGSVVTAARGELPEGNHAEFLPMARCQPREHSIHMIGPWIGLRWPDRLSAAKKPEAAT